MYRKGMLTIAATPSSTPAKPTSHHFARYPTQIVLDTLERLPAAVSLYRRMGYVPVPRYNDNPLPDIVFFGMDIADAPEYAKPKP